MIALIPESIDMQMAAVPVGFGLIAVYNGVKGWMQYRGARASLRWREVQGVILMSRVTGHHGGNRVQYNAEIRYRYQAAGRTYESDRVYFGAGEWRKNHLALANDLVTRFPEGAQVRVYVDPTRHDQAVLQQGVFDVAREKLIWAAVFTILCGIFTYATVAA